MLDPIYVVARAVLLDALDALRSHLGSVVLVGAQAIYLRVGEGDLAVAPYTTDGDLAIDPSFLAKSPDLADVLAKAHFTFRDGDVGRWWAERRIDGKDIVIAVDLLVPEAVAGPGRRAARLEGHASFSARRVLGLEAALVDNDLQRIASLDPADGRRCDVRVAGPAALLVAKAHKIAERSGGARAKDKDALDVYRLLRGSDPDDVARRLRQCKEADVSSRATLDAVGHLRALFSDRDSVASQMASRAAGGDEAIALAVSVLVGEILQKVG